MCVADQLEKASAAWRSCGIDFVDNEHALNGLLDEKLRPLREHLLRGEDPEDVVQLSGATFWEITPKYRFDLLRFDIPEVANQLALAIGLGSTYLDRLADTRTAYFRSLPDAAFWQHIDAGVRLASSGWDRLSLLLDLAYDLRLDAECNLKTVLRKLRRVDAVIEQDVDFRGLKAIRDGALFQSLEAARGEGARHEATHLLTPSIRFFAETIERLAGAGPGGDEPAGWRDLLVQHHDAYLRGIEHAATLVERRWSNE